MKNKKPLIISLVVLDLAITIALFVISIIMLAKTIGSNGKVAEGFIGYLQTHTTVYFFAFVLPLFLLLAANIIGLVIYVKKTTKKEPVKVQDLSAEQKEALRQELLRDLQGGSQEETKEE